MPLFLACLGLLFAPRIAISGAALIVALRAPAAEEQPLALGLGEP